MLKASFIIMCFFIGAFAQSETYTVKKGDTIANIARTHYGEPVFGPKGTIKKIYKLNPSLKPEVPLEPGMQVELEDGAAPGKATAAKKPTKKTKAAKAVKAAPKDDESSVVVIPANPPSTPPPPPAGPPKFHEDPLYMSPDEKAAHDMDLAPKGPTAEVTKPPPPALPVHPASNPPPPEAVKESEPEPAHEFGHNEVTESPHNYFSVIANYSFISQSATDNALGDNFTMHSDPAWGVELGWDHWWNQSFSTVFTYAVTEFTSKESSDATGTRVLKNQNLNTTELALFNRVVRWMRIGLGAAYGDHMFLEGFAGGTPVNPQVYKMSFLNPFLAAEIVPFESAKMEWLINLKLAQLPAQVGFGHDVNTGTEYFAQVALKQNFAKFSMFYGVSYSTENQTRTDAKETRAETALRIGALF